MSSKEFTLKEWERRDKKPFTFNEWIEEKIPVCPKSYFYNSNDAFKALKIDNGDLHEYWKVAKLISKETYHEIDEAKKKGFLIGAENTAEMMFRRFKKHLAKIPEKNVKAFTRGQIDEYEDKLNSNRPIKNKVLSDYVNKDLITPPIYKSFIDVQERLDNDKSYIPQWPTVKKQTENSTEWIDINDDLFLGHVYLKYQDKLKQHTGESRQENESISPPNGKLYRWIKSISKNISNDDKSKIKNPKTIDLYLKKLVENPDLGVESLRKELLQNQQIPECDFTTLENLSFNSFRGWEKRFFKVLESRSYEEYAQIFKRFD